MVDADDTVVAGPEGQEVAPAKPKAAPYSAVVYFHGIGEQRRYEELSRLVDSLDVFAHRASVGRNKAHRTEKASVGVQGERGDDDTPDDERGDPIGTLGKIRARFEPPRDDGLSDVTYLRVIRSRRVDGEAQRSACRFYEVYWAPATREGRPTREVLMWLLRQILTPLRMLVGPWRSRARLRRASLVGLCRRRSTDGTRNRDLERLIQDYNNFEGPAARREYEKGSFAEFLKFLKQRHTEHEKRCARLVSLARAWRRSFILGELGLLVILLSIGLVVLFAVAAVTGWLFVGLNALADAGLTDFLNSVGLGGLSKRLEPTLVNAILALLTLGAVFGFTRFIGGYVGDVQFWATYSETDEKYAKRAEILRQGTAVLRHVLADDNCVRVTIIAHSLGTAIAMECLQELGRYNRARQLEEPLTGPLPLDRIRHFVTLGSPVDKIHYFFESHRTPYHRYVRVFDDVRGDLGEVPFAKNRKPHIHWINVWDKADLVSGPLDSPTNGRMPWLSVDNFEISSLPFPEPGASHSAYFRLPGVVEMLFRIVFDGEFDFASAPRDERGQPQYHEIHLGPGSGRGGTRWMQAAVLFVPYCVLALIAIALSDGPLPLAIPFLALLVVTGGMVGGGLALNSVATKRML